VLGLIVVYLLQRLQGVLPLNPQGLGAAQLLRDNLLIYGVGGLVAPFIGIKLIDMLLVALQLT
jgi:potassium-transporting ATPase ATP-binding subunit